MRRGTALLAVTALFLAGVLVGVLATHVFYAWEMHRPGGLVALALRLFDANLDRQLDLSAEQRRQVDAILADTRGELLAVRHDSVARLLAIREHAFDRIAGVLTPQQQERLRRFRARHDRRAERLLGAR